MTYGPPIPEDSEPTFLKKEICSTLHLDPTSTVSIVVVVFVNRGTGPVEFNKVLTIAEKDLLRPRIMATFERRAVTRDIFSATIGSVCCCYVGQPFDTGETLLTDCIQRTVILFMS